MTTTIVPVAHGRVEVHDHGRGPALLFLHGFLVSSDLWRDVVADLSDAYRCVRIELPLGSHRLAMDPDADLSPPALARIVHTVIQHLALADVTLVGLDTGGALAQVALAQDPVPFVRLVLADCDAYEHFPPPVAMPFKVLSLIPPLGHLVLRALRRRPLRDLVVKLVMRTRDHDRERAWFGPAARDAAIRRDAIKVLRHVHSRHTLAAVPSLQAFDQPALVLWGEHDLVFPRKDAQRLVADLPDARLEIIPDSGTFVPVDNPKATASAIRAFLDHTDVGVPRPDVGVTTGYTVPDLARLTAPT